jgi:hypothetical protein
MPSEVELSDGKKQTPQQILEYGCKKVVTYIVLL